MAVETSVLVLDPDAQTRALLAGSLEKLGWKTAVTDSGLKALDLLENGGINVFIADLDAPGPDGVEVVRRARRDRPNLEVVLIASAGAMSKATEAVRLGISDYLIRPFGAVEVRRLLARLSEKHPVSDAKPAPSPDAERALRALVGDSRPMQMIRDAILKAAAKRMPVLVLGESGTGKELVARAIHACSAWHDEPFVVVDCSSLVPSLIESELFGHARGSFTTASQSRVGLLAEAGCGTVFFDEIGELPIEQQSRLLRVIQEREIRPVGSNTSVPVEARVVAATNVDVKEAIRNRTFREDLYYRLNVFAIHMPPLRERKSDILALVHHFLNRYGGDDGIADFSPEFMNRLMQYDWPGNVRQLESAVQRALALSAGVRLEVDNLPSTVIYRTERRSGAVDTARLQDLERNAIKEALQAACGDRVRAAKMLGIGKTTIYRKLKEYHLEDEELDTPPPTT
ncbi:MAG TPA: sigma-54 dependent transcriptional regulator [Terriglobia bacterium]|jgi:two-component system response regulator AtoC|nr:sigma-54 dependent transcriptional regulator [Terriglobia bacterium]